MFDFTRVFDVSAVLPPNVHQYREYPVGALGRFAFDKTEVP